MTADDLPKPRCDSVLKTLPEERQVEIAEFARNHGVIKTAQWLADSGVASSKSAVARFLSWYRERQIFLRNDTAASSLATELARECPELTGERLHQIGHIFFTSLALQKQDQKSWLMNEQIAFKKARLKFDTRKHDDKKRSLAIVRNANRNTQYHPVTCSNTPTPPDTHQLGTIVEALKDRKR